jgi:hypothetical protein
MNTQAPIPTGSVPPLAEEKKRILILAGGFASAYVARR